MLIFRHDRKTEFFDKSLPLVDCTKNVTRSMTGWTRLRVTSSLPAGNAASDKRTQATTVKIQYRSPYLTGLPPSPSIRQDRCNKHHLLCLFWYLIPFGVINQISLTTHFSRFTFCCRYLQTRKFIYFTVCFHFPCIRQRKMLSA